MATLIKEQDYNIFFDFNTLWSIIGLFTSCIEQLNIRRAF